MRVLALGVFGRRDQVLLSHFEDAVTGERLARPPGGGLLFGETSEQAIRREMREELGVELSSVRLLGVLESLFHFEGKRGHNVEFIYAVTAADLGLYERDETWGEDDGPGPAGTTPVLFRWSALTVEGTRLVPQGLRELLKAADRG